MSAESETKGAAADRRGRRHRDLAAADHRLRLPLVHVRRGRPRRHEPPEVPAADPPDQAAVHRAHRPAVPAAGVRHGHGRRARVGLPSRRLPLHERQLRRPAALGAVPRAARLRRPGAGPRALLVGFGRRGGQVRGHRAQRDRHGARPRPVPRLRAGRRRARARLGHATIAPRRWARLPTELPGLDVMRADLASGAVRAVLGLRAGRRAIRPRAMWARGPEEIGQLHRRRERRAAGPAAGAPAARGSRGRVYGIVAGPGRREAIARLQAEQQIDPARVRVYARDGAAPASADTPAWEIHGVPGPDVPAAERWAFWTAAFSRCLRCYACREGCPTCSCVRCVADKTRPRWIDSSPTPGRQLGLERDARLPPGGPLRRVRRLQRRLPRGYPAGRAERAPQPRRVARLRPAVRGRAALAASVRSPRRRGAVHPVEEAGRGPALDCSKISRTWTRALLRERRVVAPVATPAGPVWAPSSGRRRGRLGLRPHGDLAARVAAAAPRDTVRLRPGDEPAAARRGAARRAADRAAARATVRRGGSARARLGHALGLRRRAVRGAPGRHAAGGARLRHGAVAGELLLRRRGGRSGVGPAGRRHDQPRPTAASPSAP